MSALVDTKCCAIDRDNDAFWDTHQTMSDGNIWCPNGRSRSVDEMTTAIVSKYRAEVKSKYGNRKRHRQ
jgi:hypothetical protein